MNRLHYWRRHMTVIANLLLRDARPDDHTCCSHERTGTPTLLKCPIESTIGPVGHASIRVDRFGSHHHLDRGELSCRYVCSGVSKQVVLLEGLDCLYHLPIHPIPVTLPVLEQPGKDLQLEKILWILLPHKLSKTWPENRIKRISSG